MSTFHPELPMAVNRIFAAASAAVAALSLALAFGALTPPDAAFGALRKPTWQPALYTLQLSWVFAHALAATTLAFLIREMPSRRRRRALGLVLLQYTVLLAWPFLLFGLDSLSLAFFNACLLWLVTFGVVAAASQVRPLAGGLQVPMLAWVSFMLVLNGVVVALNLHG